MTRRKLPTAGDDELRQRRAAGTGGRRALAPTTATFPPLGETEEEIRAFCAAVVAAVTAGTLDPRTADSLARLANIALRARSATRTDRDLARIEAMERAVESLARTSAAAANGVDLTERTPA